MAPSGHNPRPDRFASRLTWDQLDPEAIRRLIHLARAEDVHGAGLLKPCRYPVDTTTRLLDPGCGSAALAAREPMVVAGTPLVPFILEAYGGAVEFVQEAREGQFLRPGESIGTLSGDFATLLTAERILLNFLQKLSGIATRTRSFVDRLGDSPARILDTRKTTPGFRLLEKLAVVAGGGWNHRLGLFDRIMFKDNHLAFSEYSGKVPMKDLIQRARERYPELPIQVEVDRIDQIQPAIQAGAECLLLDNFSLPDLRKALEIINNQVVTEVSGNVGLETIRAVADCGPDFISTGSTIHQATWVDMGLDWRAPRNVH